MLMKWHLTTKQRLSVCLSFLLSEYLKIHTSDHFCRWWLGTHRHALSILVQFLHATHSILINLNNQLHSSEGRASGLDSTQRERYKQRPDKRQEGQTTWHALKRKKQTAKTKLRLRSAHPQFTE